MIEVEVYTATPTDWDARGAFTYTDEGEIEAAPLRIALRQLCPLRRAIMQCLPQSWTTH
jgi:hypothetical protein